MVLSTGRVLEHWHTGSMTRRADVLDAIEPEAVAFMSPWDLRPHRPARRATAIRVETRRGAVEAMVRADRDVPGRHGVHAVLLRRGGRQPADQPGARSVRARSRSSSSARHG